MPHRAITYSDSMESIEYDVNEMINSMISCYEEDYTECIEDMSSSNYDTDLTNTIKDIDPDFQYTNYEDLKQYVFNDMINMTDRFEDHMDAKINFAPWIVMKIYNEYIDNVNETNDWEVVFNYYVYDLASDIIGSLEYEQETKMERYLELRRKNCSRVIQRQWEKCRWNPKYQMCHTCQLKDLEETCGMTFDETGKMVEVA